MAQSDENITEENDKASEDGKGKFSDFNGILLEENTPNLLRIRLEEIMRAHKIFVQEKREGNLYPGSDLSGYEHSLIGSTGMPLTSPYAALATLWKGGSDNQIAIMRKERVYGGFKRVIWVPTGKVRTQTVAYVGMKLEFDENYRDYDMKDIRFGVELPEIPRTPENYHVLVFETKLKQVDGVPAGYEPPKQIVGLDPKLLKPRTEFSLTGDLGELVLVYGNPFRVEYRKRTAETSEPIVSNPRIVP